MKKLKTSIIGRRGRRKLVILAAATFLPVAGLMAQNSTPGDRPAVARPLLKDDEVRAAAEKLQGALTDDAKDRDDYIKAAQDRFKKLKGESTAPATITDEGAAAKAKALQARPAATAPAATPVSATAERPSGTATGTPKPTSADKPPTPAPAPAVPAANLPPAAPPAPLANPGNIPPPVPLKPRYEKTENSTSGGEAMEITAHESVMDQKNNKATFKGDVIVHHPTFIMKSEHLEVFMNDKENPQLGPDGKEPPFKNAIATGSMVEIEQRVIESGTQVVQIAKSRRAEFDGVTGDTILTGGPPFLQKGKQIIRPTEETAKIILKSNGEHQVIGRNKVKFQIKGGSGGKTGPNLGGSLDSITKRKDR